MFSGSTCVNIIDKEKNVQFPVWIHYPTNSPSHLTNIGPYSLDIAPETPIMQQRFPLIIISHGNSGYPLLYRSISLHLSRMGFIVALIEHPGNNRSDNHLAHTETNLQFRPRHVRMCIDFLLHESPFSQHIQHHNIAMIGHSMGAYTALAVAGGIARTKEAKIIETESDNRVKALILLAAAAGWFKNGLHQVTIPMYVMMAEIDEITPTFNLDIICESVPNPQLIKHKIIPNAGHFSFLTPFPVQFNRPGFLPATDPPDFNREAFHQWLPLEIENYLRTIFNSF